MAQHNCKPHQTIHVNPVPMTSWKDIIGDVKKNPAMAQILRDILKKVDKEDDKCLIPISELERLRTLYNYDDTLIQAQINNIHSLLDGINATELRNQLYSLEMALFDVQQEVHAQNQKIAELQRKVDDAPKKEDIPTRVSQLDNDSGYVDKSGVIEVTDFELKSLGALIYEEI